MISSSFLPTTEDDPDADELADAEGEKERRELALEREVSRDGVLPLLGVIPGKEIMEGGREEEVEGGRGTKGWVGERKTLKGTGGATATSGGGESLERMGGEAEAEGESVIGVGGEIRRGEEGRKGGGRLVSVKEQFG